ncbi:predicted protein [Histoplasma mississippiense (nom. inval.)]|uniref:predicted protein n=1 Tax=Ajellomyces capsulatus (strain NAm1 / WU24) TaxID=2059318 RepID=UPI000157B5F7|nr:predicted protein [Histoplasma mississippiense (nom. inval.)]EDN02641.1 predicted protein [Histoplasma mississippiense (nom. inval.)]
MGITESKLLVASFSRACNEAEMTDGPSQNKNILADPLVQSQIKNILSNPQRRIFLIIFARLKARLGHVRLSPVAQELLIFILLHSGFVVEDASDIYENFGDWASRGEKYEALAMACGGLDFLFVLPDNISDTFWEKDLPRSGKARDELIKTLQQGIRRFVEEFSDVSILEEVIAYIWPRLEEEISSAMKQHEGTHPQQSAHILTGDPNIFHGEPTTHAPTSNVDGPRPQLLVPHVFLAGLSI